MIGRFVIPEPTLRAVREAPVDRATLLLLRHSARGPILPGEPGEDVLLVPEGITLAETLGQLVGNRLGALHASPVPRCVETARAIACGAGVQADVVEDVHLGRPGVYVVEGGTAWSTWQVLGHERVMANLVAGERLPGLADPRPASRRLVEHMREIAAGCAGIHVFVTHDSLVTTVAAHCLGLTLGKADWPWYLEALALVDGDGGLRAAYRGWSGPVVLA